MLSREERAAVAAETLRIIESGAYTVDGVRVEIREATQRCVRGTRLYEPGAFDAAVPGGAMRYDTTVTVVDETSLQGARRLCAGSSAVGVLNFASARNPGGGFLGGSQAQEESLARSSALYASQTSPAAARFYEHHRREPSLLYSDHVLVSPACPVFRDDAGRLLPAPYEVTFITAAAPNRNAVAQNQPELLPEIPAVLERRSAAVLAVAIAVGLSDLVLGAWGCGVFGNDPALVAQILFAHLRPGGRFHGCFARVDFSIHDTARGRPVFAAFQAETGLGG